MKNWEKIIRLAFNEGQEIVIEDAGGNFVWGEIQKIVDDGILMKNKLGHSKGLNAEYVLSKFIHWEDITFIAQDGFPVRELSDTSFEQAWDLATEQNTDEMRKLLMDQANAYRNEKKNMETNSSQIKLPSPKRTPRTRMSSRMSFGGGCPFIFEDVAVKDILYPGNDSPLLWGSEQEETVIMEAKDGALLYSYDMDHLFTLR